MCNVILINTFIFEFLFVFLFLLLLLFERQHISAMEKLQGRNFKIHIVKYSLSMRAIQPDYLDF